MFCVSDPAVAATVMRAVADCDDDFDFEWLHPDSIVANARHPMTIGSMSGRRRFFLRRNSHKAPPIKNASVTPPRSDPERPDGANAAD